MGQGLQRRPDGRRGDARPAAPPHRSCSTSTATATGCAATGPGPKPPARRWPDHDHRSRRVTMPSRSSCPICQHHFTPTGRQQVLLRRLPGRRLPATPRRRPPIARRAPRPGPAGPSPSTNATAAATGPSASSAAPTAPPSCARSASAATCPNCDEPVAVAELLDQEVIASRLTYHHQQPPTTLGPTDIFGDRRPAFSAIREQRLDKRRLPGPVLPHEQRHRHRELEALGEQLADRRQVVRPTGAGQGPQGLRDRGTPHDHLDASLARLSDIDVAQITLRPSGSRLSDLATATPEPAWARLAAFCGARRGR